MADQHFLAIEHDRLGAFAEQFLEHALLELAARKAQVAEFLGIDEAADAVVTEHQAVFFLDLAPGDVLRVGEPVADHLEHQRIGLGREHRHDHAALAIGAHQAFLGVRLEMAEQVAITFGLALLGATENGVELLDRLVRQQAAEEHDDVGDGGQVDMKIAARIAEQQRDLVDFGDHGIGAHPVLGTDQGDDQRRDPAAGDGAADQVGAAFAEEGGLDQLDRVRAGATTRTHALAERARDHLDASADVGIAVGERIVGEDALADRIEAVGGRVAMQVDGVLDAGSRLLVEGDEFDVGGDAGGVEIAP